MTLYQLVITRRDPGPYKLTLFNDQKVVRTFRGNWLCIITKVAKFMFDLRIYKQ